MLMRRLFDGERFSHDGRFYSMTDALSQPLPIQPHLPILIGGSGPRKTLRTVALRGDAWNTTGPSRRSRPSWRSSTNTALPSGATAPRSS